MRIADLPIDPRAVQILDGQGIVELYPPQAEALPHALAGENLVLAIPTASGKSLVAYLAILKSVLGGGKALYIVPLRALAREKFEDLLQFKDLGIKVALAMGDYDSDDPTLQRYDVIVATSEKADSLLRHRSHWLGQLTVVVADEVHLINDAGRGPTLEVTLAKLRQVNPRAQVIALSATIANSQEIAEWLGAVHIHSEWRPVPLKLGVHEDGRIHWSDGGTKYLLEKGDDLEVLVKDALRDGGQCLVFVNTRQSTETLARRLPPVIAAYMGQEASSALGETAEGMASAEEEHTSMGSRLARCVKGGVAFHHAGLTNDQRRVVEDSFRKGKLKVIVATPTLCLHPNTLITTRRGPVKISEMREGDEVLTHQGRFCKVLGTSKRPFEGELLKVKADGMLPVLMTREHCVLRNTRYPISRRGPDGTRQRFGRDEPGWARAEELKVDDEVLSPVEIPDFGADGGSVALRIHGITFVGRNQFGSTFPHPYARPVPQLIQIDETTAEFLGLYAAEGCTGRNGVVAFYIATYEQNLTDFICKCMTEIFHVVPCVTDRSRHRRRVHCCSRALATFFDESFGRGAANKHFPEELITGPLHVIRGLVRGAWLGDGNISPEGARKAIYSTVSPRLGEQIVRMLKRLGYMPSVSVVPARGMGKLQQYRLELSGTQGTRFIAEVMGVDPQTIPWENRTYNTKNLLGTSFRSPIRRIQKVPYLGEVYNLHVEGDESYSCSFAFAVHNSAGINLPARRVVIRDVHRYDANFGYTPISVMEIKQMCGRAGRPQYDDFGEAILLARHGEDAEYLQETYFDAPPEAVESKLGTEPALRVHLLAIIATDHVRTEEELHRFMERTFYHHQGDVEDIEGRIQSVLDFLHREGFIRRGEFLEPTLFGRRTSDLYIDPLSAVVLRDALQSKPKGDDFAFLHAICATPDMPRFYLRRKDYEWVEAKIQEEDLLVRNEEYDLLQAEVKTAALLEAWIEERTEDEIVKKFVVGPGDIRRMVDNGEWLLYSMHELARLFNRDRMKPLAKLLPRVRYGIKEELLELIQLRGVGRVRARVLHDRGLRTLDDLRGADPDHLARLPTFGPALAQSIMKQLGREAEGPREVEARRAGQQALYDYR